MMPIVVFHGGCGEGVCISFNSHFTQRCVGKIILRVIFLIMMLMAWLEGRLLFRRAVQNSSASISNHDEAYKNTSSYCGRSL